MHSTIHASIRTRHGEEKCFWELERGKNKCVFWNGGFNFVLAWKGWGDQRENGIDIGLRLGQQRVVRSQRQRFRIRREEGENLFNKCFFFLSLLFFLTDGK